VNALAACLAATQPAEDPGAQPPPLRSIHTSNFPGLLQELGISLSVSTYQAGKLVMVRPDGDGLNTHFRGFPLNCRAPRRGSPFHCFPGGSSSWLYPSRIPC
jgi:hypothetical protein